MALKAYSVGCVVFILVCLGLLWPIHAASSRIERQNRQLRHDLNLDAARSDEK